MTVSVFLSKKTKVKRKSDAGRGETLTPPVPVQTSPPFLFSVSFYIFFFLRRVEIPISQLKHINLNTHCTTVTFCIYKI